MIPVLARFLNQITEKNFIIEDKVQGKVTVVSPIPVNADKAYSIFQSVLRAKGYTTLPSGAAGILNITPSFQKVRLDLSGYTRFAHQFH